MIKMYRKVVLNVGLAWLKLSHSRVLPESSHMT